MGIHGLRKQGSEFRIDRDGVHDTPQQRPHAEFNVNCLGAPPDGRPRGIGLI